MDMYGDARIHHHVCFMGRIRAQTRSGSAYILPPIRTTLHPTRFYFSSINERKE